jgi:hypothetical protein
LSFTLREEQRLMVFDGRMLRKIFGPKTEEVRGGSEELHDLYSPNIMVVKSGTIRWVGHVAYTGKKHACRVLVDKAEGRRHLEDLGVHWQIILKWITNRMGTVAISWEHNNEPWGSINIVNILTSGTTINSQGLCCVELVCQVAVILSHDFVLCCNL